MHNGLPDYRREAPRGLGKLWDVLRCVVKAYAPIRHSEKIRIVGDSLGLQPSFLIRLVAK